MKDKEEKGSPCLPIATLAAPRTLEAQPIGCVAVSGEWNITDFGAMINDLAVKLAKKAKEQFPTAKSLYNFRWREGTGYHGHTWYNGVADVYGEEGLVFGNKQEP